jgi:hypothetical protein
MPRKRIHTKNQNWNKNVKRKFRIGNRKGGVSALTMSTKALLVILSDESKAKYHNNAAAALMYRGNLAQ